MKESEPSFQSKIIRARNDPNRIFNPNESEVRIIRINSNWKLGWINPSSDWFVLLRIENSVRTHSDWCLGLNQIKSDWFLDVFRIGLETYSGMARNSSDSLRMNFNSIHSPAYYITIIIKYFVTDKADCNIVLNQCNILAS